MKVSTCAAGGRLPEAHDWPLGVESAWPAATMKTPVAAAGRKRRSRLLLAALLAAFAVALWLLGPQAVTV